MRGVSIAKAGARMNRSRGVMIEAVRSFMTPPWQGFEVVSLTRIITAREPAGKATSAAPFDGNFAAERKRRHYARAYFRETESRRVSHTQPARGSQLAESGNAGEPRSGVEGDR